MCPFDWQKTRNMQLRSIQLRIRNVANNGSTTVVPVSSECHLGIFVDSDLVMLTHVCRTVSSCFAALRQCRSIRHLVSATVFQSLVAALVLCRLDYGNGTLVSLPAYRVRRLQSVQNNCGKLKYNYHYITQYFPRYAITRLIWSCACKHTNRCLRLYIRYRTEPHYRKLGSIQKS